MASLDLYIDTFSGEFVTGPTNATLFTLPNFKQGDVMPFRIWLLARTTSYPTISPFTVVNIAAISLKMAIGTKSGTGTGSHLVNQFSWNKSADNQYFYANVAFNTTELNSAIGSSESLSGKWLEIEFTQDGYPTTVLQRQVTIDADVIKGASTTLPAGQVAMTAEEANATFVKKFGGNGDSIILVSADGTKKRMLYVDNNGNLMSDLIS